MSYTEQEILEVLRSACHPQEVPLSPEQIATRIERHRKFLLEETDISLFTRDIDEHIRGYEEMQASRIRWTAILMFLEKTVQDVKEIMADQFPA